MTTALSPTISNDQPAWTASDWNALRAAGLTYVEKYAHNLWTDYNRHDPGVTLLELLCYAITDLSQRTALDMKDLMRSALGSDKAMQSAFPRADQVLPGPPVTLLDYRKLLLDVPGVRNVWIVPNLATKLHFLSRTAQPSQLEYYVEGQHVTGSSSVYVRDDLTLRGLYDIRVDLDPAVIASLKETFDAQTVANLQATQAKATTTRNLRDLDLLTSTAKAEALAKTEQYIREVKIGELQDAVRPDETRQATTTQARRVLARDQSATGATGVDSLPTPGGGSTAAVSSELVTQEINTVRFATVKIGADEKLLPVTEFAKPDAGLSSEVKAINEVLNWVKQTYLNHRNLGEDCVVVERVATQEVKIQAEIELLPGANLTTVHAQVLLAFDQYLAPIVKRYSLAEMQGLTDATGQPLSMEQIFEGPRLQRGFIRDEELAATELRSRVYASDLIGLVKAVPGVRDVRTLTLLEPNDSTNTPRLEVAIPRGKRAQLKLTDDFPKLVFYQGTRKVSTSSNRPMALTRFEALRATHVAAQERSVDPVAIPAGTAYDLSTYRPLALDLPATYGVAPNTMPANASLTRRNQARQLQAYLLFFDQLLANYLAQLMHAKDLLSTDLDSPATYFGQVLDAQQLPELSELYANSQALTDALVAQAGDSVLEGARKSRFVDHLLARFAESFSEYGLLLYSASEPRYDWDQLLVKTRLAADRLQFAPGRGFQYHMQSWMGDSDPVAPPRGGTKWIDWTPLSPQQAAAMAAAGISPSQVNDAVAINNVPGIVRRFGRLLGMQDFTARYQADAATGSAATVVNPNSPPASGGPGGGGPGGTSPENQMPDAADSRYFTLADRANPALNKVYAVSKKYFLSTTVPVAAVTAEAATANSRALSRSNWKVVQLEQDIFLPSGVTLHKGAFTLQLTSAATPAEALAYGVASFPTDIAAEQHLAALLNSLNTAGETILVVEHALLRPAPGGALPKEWLLPPNGQLYWPRDPYSYCITVLLPGYTPRFAPYDEDNLPHEERLYAERILRNELPAHVLADIRWIETKEEMHDFEVAYHNWAQYKRTQTGPAYQDALVNLLNDRPAAPARAFSGAFSTAFS